MNSKETWLKLFGKVKRTTPAESVKKFGDTVKFLSKDIIDEDFRGFSKDVIEKYSRCLSDDLDDRLMGDYKDKDKKYVHFVGGSKHGMCLFIKELLNIVKFPVLEPMLIAEKMDKIRMCKYEVYKLDWLCINCKKDKKVLEIPVYVWDG